MIKIAICDDNKYCNEVNKQLVKEYLQEKDIKAIIQSFNHGNQLLKSDERFDIVFLDIDMPGKSGMEVAELLREKDFDGVIIFVSSHKDYVYDVFKLEAFRFLVKPANKIKMYEALDASIKKISKLDEEYLIIDVDKNRIEKVKLSDVIYIETYGRKTIVYVKDKEIESIAKMKYFEETLSSQHFFRPHVSYMVNYLHIDEFDKSQIMMNNKHSIPLSRLKVNQFKASYFDYIRSI